MTGSPTLDIAAGRARLRLQRPDKRNRIEPPDIESIIGHCADATERAQRGDVRVLTLEADGPSWCSGYHLGALAHGDRPRYSFSDLCSRIEALPVPTMAVLGGDVHGGGTDLALACDFRVGAEGIVLGMPAARIGLQYYASGLRRFVERIGPDATKRIFLTGETIGSSELVRLGYLTDAVPADDLEVRAAELCAAIGSLGPEAVRRTKAAINRLAEGVDEDTLAAVEASHVESVRSDEHQQAMAGLRQKRAEKSN